MRAILLLIVNKLTVHCKKLGTLFLLSIPLGKRNRMSIMQPFPLPPGSYPTSSFSRPTLDDLHYVLRKKLKTNTATGLDGWRPHELKSLPDCLLAALLDVYDLCEQVGRFPSSFYHSYTTLIPKGLARTPLSLRPITVLFVPCRIYASLRCQTWLKWQDTWIHRQNFRFVKVVVLLVSTATFPLTLLLGTNITAVLPDYSLTSLNVLILYSIIWSVLQHYGCDPAFIALLSHLYTNISRCFRYAWLHRVILVCY